MILDSLREALARMADTPVLWITGLYLGSLFALDILFPAMGNTLLGARIGFLGLCALPFFLGGSYGAIQGEVPSIHSYIGAGARFYFRILLAGAVIVSASLVTVFLVMVTVAMMGGSLEAGTFLALPGVLIPFAFFTFFFDTAIVYEDRKVLDSIRRSVDFVTGYLRRAAAFYLVNLAIGMFILFISTAIWSFTIADQIQPFPDTNLTAFQNLTAGQFLNLIGLPGLLAGVIIGFFAVMIGSTLLVSFKACYFRRAAVAAPAGPAVGGYDEKGRWYRY